MSRKSIMLQSAQTFYKSCMDNDKNDFDPSDVLDEMSKVGGWPIMEGSRWNESAF